MLVIINGPIHRACTDAHIRTSSILIFSYFFREIPIFHIFQGEFLIFGHFATNLNILLCFFTIISCTDISLKNLALLYSAAAYFSQYFYIKLCERGIIL